MSISKVSKAVGVLKKRLGQHLLINAGILRRIAEAAEVSGRRAVEIGAGDGRLSQYLLAAGPRSLVLIEKDPRFVEILRRRFPGLNVIKGDALDYGFNEDVVVGNIPYNISGPLIAKLAGAPIKNALLLVQYEFGKRLMAKPGGLSRISVIAQRHFEVSALFKVPRTMFLPRPKVDGLVVRLIKKKTMDRAFEEFSRQLFRFRNKKVSKSIENAGALGEKRPRHLTIAEVEELFLRWNDEH